MALPKLTSPITIKFLEEVSTDDAKVSVLSELMNILSLLEVQRMSAKTLSLSVWNILF